MFIKETSTIDEICRVNQMQYIDIEKYFKRCDCSYTVDKRQGHEPGDPVSDPGYVGGIGVNPAAGAAGPAFAEVFGHGDLRRSEIESKTG